MEFKNEVLIGANGYPASWDLFSDRIAPKVKEFIKLVEKNKNVLELRERLDLVT